MGQVPRHRYLQRMPDSAHNSKCTFVPQQPRGTHRSTINYLPFCMQASPHCFCGSWGFALHDREVGARISLLAQIAAAPLAPYCANRAELYLRARESLTDMAALHCLLYKAPWVATYSLGAIWHTRGSLAALIMGPSTATMQRACSQIARCWDSMHNMNSKAYSRLGGSVFLHQSAHTAAPQHASSLV